MKHARDIADWLFRDRQTGKITIAQFPNVALWIFIGSLVVRRVVESGNAAFYVARIVGIVALLWWAVDEIVRGVCPWRRILGAAVGAFTVIGLATQLR